MFLRQYFGLQTEKRRVIGEGSIQHKVPLRDHEKKWFSLLLAVFPVVVAVILAAIVFSRGTAGFQIEKTQNCFVVSKVNVGLNPVRAGDLITHVGSLAYHEVIGYLLAGKKSTDPVQRITVVRDKRTIALTVRYASLTPIRFLESVWPYSLFALLSLTLCIAALCRAPDDQPITLFVLTLSSFALLFVCQFPIQFGILDPKLQSAISLTTIVANWIGFSAWFHFALRFPAEQQRWQEKPLLITAVVYLLPPLAAICFSMIRSEAGMDFFGWLHRTRRWAVPFIVAAIFAKQWHDLRSTKSILVRNQLRLILTGAIGGIGVYLFLYLIPNMIVDRPLVPFYVVGVCNVLIPLSFFLALTHFRFLDVDWMISWTVSHILLIGGLITAYFMAASFFERLVQGRGLSIEGFSVFYLLVVAFFFVPVRNWLGHMIDVLFFRQKVDFQKVLYEFSGKVVSAIKMTDLTRVITYELPVAFNLSHAVLVVFSQEKIRIRPENHPDMEMINGLQLIPETIGKGSGFLLSDLNYSGGVAREIDLLRQAGIKLVLRLQSRTTFIGMLLLGAKRNNTIYSGREIRGLIILANQLATAVENALNYESLERSQTTLRKTFSRMVQAEKLAAIGETAAILAHEIKNPLGVIRSSAQYLVEDRQTPENRDELLGYIVGEVDRLSQVVNNLLGLARSAPPDFKPMEIQELLSSLFARWKKSEDHNAKVVMDCQCNHSEPILADRQQLAQVFLNLIRNSEDAMPHGGRIDILSDLDRQNAGIVISLTDSGPGVAPEEVEKLWQNFYTTKRDGVGLGLSVCKQIVQAHGGEIEIANSENGGLCVVMRLPLRPEPALDTPVNGFSTAHSASAV